MRVSFSACYAHRRWCARNLLRKVRICYPFFALTTLSEGMWRSIVMQTIWNGFDFQPRSAALGNNRLTEMPAQTTRSVYTQMPNFTMI